MVNQVILTSTVLIKLLTFSKISYQISLFCTLNPLMPGGNKKVTHT